MSLTYSFPTRSGLVFDIAKPSSRTVDRGDICWGLAHTLRYGGHSIVPVNVASHSINVASLLPPKLKIYGLLHDAHEAYIGDVIRPLKKLLGDAWKEIERSVDSAIAQRFDIDDELLHHPDVRAADMVVYSWERRDLVGIPAWDTDYDVCPKETCPNLGSLEADAALNIQIFEALASAEW